MKLAKNASRAEDFAEGKRYPVVGLSGAALERKGLFRRRTPFDVALNCCHGGMGEDGTLSAAPLVGTVCRPLLPFDELSAGVHG